MSYSQGKLMPARAATNKLTFVFRWSRYPLQPKVALVDNIAVAGTRRNGREAASADPGNSYGR